MNPDVKQTASGSKGPSPVPFHWLKAGIWTLTLGCILRLALLIAQAPTGGQSLLALPSLSLDLELD